MKFKKVLALFLTVTMLVSFSTMFVTANTVSVSYQKSWVNVGESMKISISRKNGSHVSKSINGNVITYIGNDTFVGVSAGIGEISFFDKNGNSDIQTTYITVYETRGIVNNEEYYIMNAEYDTLLSLSDKNGKNSKDIVLSSRTNDSNKQWKLSQRSTGLYTIESMFFSDQERGKGLHITSNVRDVYLRTTGSSKSQFEIRRVNEAPYQGLYLICYGSKYLAATSSTTVALTSTLNSECYWSLSRVEKQIAELDAFSYMWEGIAGGGINTTKHVSKFNTEMDLYGYTGNFFVNRKVANTYNDLPNCSIFVFNGHSDPGKLYYYDSDTETLTGLIRATTGVGSSGYTSVYTISNLDANELANMQCVLLLGCNTANDVGIHNMMDELYNKGAHFVLGTTQSVNVDDSDNFLEGFLDGMGTTGYDIYDCYLDGLDKAYDSDLGNGLFGYYPAVFIGDTDQYLN